jgi:hypothetical protein
MGKDYIRQMVLLSKINLEHTETKLTPMKKFTTLEVC